MNTRRSFLEISSLGIIGATSLNQFRTSRFSTKSTTESDIYKYFPTTHPEEVSAVVGASHTNFDRVKELVDARPELSKASWDWGFGDVESALGAASHMGRKDIAEYLISKGARPDIFTLAMMGKLEAVKAIIEAMPGVQTILGPHGFTLMHHAKIRLRRENVNGSEKEMQEALVEYLESVEGADTGQMSKEMSDQEKEKYLGKYDFGKGENDYFEVKLNMRKMLSISRGDTFGRGLNKIDEHIFAPGGAPSVRIVFEVSEGVSQSVTIHDPEAIISAKRRSL